MALLICMLNKIIPVVIITAVIIITAVGLFSVLDKSEKLDIDNQSTNQEPNTPKKITLELTDGINMGETSGP